MTAPVFVDANVLIYARDSNFPDKKVAAESWLKALWKEERARTSVQVLNEFYVAVTQLLKPGLGRDEAWQDVLLIMSWNPQPIDLKVVARAHEVQRLHGLNWWDCLIVGSAQILGCAMLLSEDLQDGANYGGVTVRSPFTLAVAEEGTAYNVPPLIEPRYRGRGRPRRHPSRAASGAG